MQSGNIASIMPEAMGVFKINEDNHDVYKKAILKIIDNATDDLKRVGRNGTPLYHICSNKDQNLFKQFSELKQLRREIIKCSLAYIEMTGYLCQEVIVTDAWLNVGQKHSTLNWHNHSNSYISGTYYVNFNPSKHALLSFKNDRLHTSSFNSPSISIPVNANLNTKFNSSAFQAKVPEGSILLWKSHLVHGYDMPNKEDNRITLSFNIMPKICSTEGQIFSFKVSSD